jgi:hypothetical protein
MNAPEQNAQAPGDATKRARRHKASKGEQVARVAEVVRMLAAGQDRESILRDVAEKWGVRTRTCEGLLAAARRQMQASGAEEAAAARVWASARLSEVYRRAMERGHLRTALSAAIELAKLSGCFRTDTLPPIRVTLESGELPKDFWLDAPDELLLAMEAHLQRHNLVQPGDVTTARPSPDGLR